MSLTDDETDTEQGGETGDGSGPEPFERNRFFHGKLMTARDMEVEQDYHARRLETLARHVLGEGIVCGLETSVAESEADRGLEATVTGGLALDRRGRPVVVHGQATGSVSPIPAGDGVSVYLRHESCKAEQVPKSGSEDACGTECEYSRLREGSRVEFEGGSPDAEPERKGQKHVAGLDFPSRDAVGADRETAPAADDEALLEPAATYYTDEDGAPEGCGSPGDPRIFLGYFEPSDGEWRRVPPGEPGGEPRPQVYTNDMLYAAVTRHAADFDNPHEVTAGRIGALVGVNGIENPGGSVELRSPDGSVSIDPAEDEPRIDLAAAGGGVSPDLEASVLHQNLQYTLESLYDVATTFPEEGAGVPAAKGVDETRTAIEEGAYGDRTAYVDYVRAVLKDEIKIRRQLADSTANLGAYRSALDDLFSTLNGNDLVSDLRSGTLSAEQVFAVAIQQREVCQAARLLSPEGGDSIALPGGYTIEKGYANQPIGVGSGGDGEDEDGNGGNGGGGGLFGFPELSGSSATNVADMLSGSDFDVRYETAAGDTVTQPGPDHVVTGEDVDPTNRRVTYTVEERHPFETLPGLGGGRRSDLESAGIATLEDLSAASVSEIANATGASEQRVREWKQDAYTMVPD